ncbi:MAG: kinase [Bdellovibrionales bacterium]
MIISQTPYRISFFGGGTDFPSWYRRHGGSVLSTTINRYVYISCRYLPPFFEHKHRIVYSQIETVRNVESIVHPAVRNIFQFLEVQDGLEVHYDGDLPARSGIGSSSSFTVGLLNTLFALQGRRKSKRELAELAIHVEQDVIKETVGSQDQVAAAYGGLNRIDFHRDSSFSVNPVVMPPERAEDLNARLMLFFTGFSRIAEGIEKSKMRDREAWEIHLARMQGMVDGALQVLESQWADLDEFGRMLHEGWLLKRSLSEQVSNSTIDEIYQKGLAHGALGGKLLGAGGGGFLLFYVPLDRQRDVRAALSGLIEVDFKFEYGGAQIILYNPDMASHRPPISSLNGVANRFPEISGS